MFVSLPEAYPSNIALSSACTGAAHGDCAGMGVIVAEPFHWEIFRCICECHFDRV